MTTNHKTHCVKAWLLALLCTGCPLSDKDIWCGHEWKAQVSGATGYGVFGQTLPIPASSTTHAACFTMQENQDLDEAEEANPTYVALKSQLESGAIANCELVGSALPLDQFSHTDCATAGTPPVQVSVFTDDESCTKPFGLSNLDNWDICQAYYDCPSGETGWDCVNGIETGGEHEPGEQRAPTQ